MFCCVLGRRSRLECRLPSRLLQRGRLRGGIKFIRQREWQGTTHSFPSILFFVVWWCADGVWRLYKGLQPLWGRQIPYTMMKFASFERVVEYIYSTLPKPKSEYGKLVQTEVQLPGTTHIRTIYHPSFRTPYSLCVDADWFVLGFLCRWLHCWYLLCRRLPSRGRHGLKTQLRTTGRGICWCGHE